jgi:sodium transport system permease protein
MNDLVTAWTVFLKEFKDAQRDRRTLLAVFIPAVLLGPLTLMLISTLFQTIETQAEQRTIVVQGQAYGPSLINFIERQTFAVQPAPENYESLLSTSKLADPVLVIPNNFEQDLHHGESPAVVIAFDSNNNLAQRSVGRIEQLIRGFNQERNVLTLTLRGLSADLMDPLQVDYHDLASAQSRASKLTGMLPFFIIMAVLMGALNAALDTTAGEREKGTLEPLLMNPSAAWALVVGKWAAVFSVTMLIALLSSFSFIPGQWLLQSDLFATMFQFEYHEALMFLLVLSPFAAAFSALLMAVAIRSKSHKEAQANGTIVLLLISIAPIFGMTNLGSQETWHFLIPGLAQSLFMTDVLKGEAMNAAYVIDQLLICSLITGTSILYVIRRLKTAAVT